MLNRLINKRREHDENRTEKYLGIYMTPDEKVKSKKSFKWVIVIMIVFWLFMIFGKDFGGVTDNDVSDMAEGFLIDSLYNPEGAEIRDAKVKEIDDDQWRVTGIVEAYTDDGFYEEAYYFVELSYNEDTDTFQLEYLDFSE